MSATLTPIPYAATSSYAETPDPVLFRRARTWWTLIVLCHMAQGNALIFSAATTASEKLKTVKEFYAPPTTLLLLTALMWTIAAGLMVSRLGPTLRIMLKQRALLAFAIAAFLSTLWSQDPQLTFRRSITLSLFFAFAWQFVASYQPTDQMRVLLAAGVILALPSAAMALVLPQYGLDSGGAWRGVFGQKNSLGHAMLFLFSGLAFRPISSRRELRTAALQAILPIGLIILSRSISSLILGILLVAVRVCGPSLAKKRRDQLPFLLYATLFGVLAVTLGWETVLFLLGRDSTLTGRTHEWAILSFYAGRHLWLGYGYQAFWTGTGDSLQAMKILGGALHGSDSGFLDTILQLGLLGVGLFAVVILFALRDFAKLYRWASPPLAAYWYVGIVLAIFIGSYVEDLFSIPGGVSAFIFVVACAGLTTLKVQDRNVAD